MNHIHTGATVLQPSVSTLYQEHEKKTTLTETAMSLHNELTQKRKEGLKAARQLQTEKCDQNLDVIVSMVYVYNCCSTSTSQSYYWLKCLIHVFITSLLHGDF